MAVLVLACALSFQPRPLFASSILEKGAWTADSSTARAITGDIEFTNDQIRFMTLGFTIASIRRLQPVEAASVFDADSNGGGSGNLYRLFIPAKTRFLKKNTLCGSEDTQWMATYIEGRVLRIAFFSGPQMPVFTTESISNSTDLCGTFSYSR